jgi:acetoin utilization deacetylase AcuC-like enzyme
MQGVTRVVLADDPVFDEHRAEGPHPERPARLEAARTAVERSGVGIRRLNPRCPTREELERVHHGAYLDRLESLRGRTTTLDSDTYVAPRSIEAAQRAAGAALAITDELLSGRADLGIALVRPPGHHATPSGAMGFCLLNNVALAAEAARAAGLRRVAIVDWDVHHGNGTQDAFEADPSVLYVSLHQWPCYPGTGAATEQGTGDGRGYTVNVPLSPGADDATYSAAIEDLITPVLEQFAPELLLVSAGFDAHMRDPLASMELSATGFEQIAGRLAKACSAAGERPTPIGVVLEGGYDLQALEESLAATLGALAAPTRLPRTGPSAGSHDGALVSVSPPPPISSRHLDDLERARRCIEANWRLY